MNSPRHQDIIDIIEQAAPRCRQESYDNTGWQCGDPAAPCTGVMLCVDVTQPVIDEARARGCNLIITHHPLLFRATRTILPGDRVNDCLISAIRGGIAIYSCHTAIDNTPDYGVSFAMARALGLTAVTTLTPGPVDGSGCGAVGNLRAPLTARQLVELVKRTFGSPVARCSHVPDTYETISRVALCGGAGADFIPDAIRAGAQAYITSDSKHNQFIDLTDRIFLIDIGHFESEECTKQIFYDIISKKMPTFALYKSTAEINPINYL